MDVESFIADKSGSIDKHYPPPNLSQLGSGQISLGSPLQSTAQALPQTPMQFIPQSHHQGVAPVLTQEHTRSLLPTLQESPFAALLPHKIVPQGTQISQAQAKMQGQAQSQAPIPAQARVLQLTASYQQPTQSLHTFLDRPLETPHCMLVPTSIAKSLLAPALSQSLLQAQNASTAGLDSLQLPVHDVRFGGFGCDTALPGLAATPMLRNSRALLPRTLAPVTRSSISAREKRAKRVKILKSKRLKSNLKKIIGSADISMLLGTQDGESSGHLSDESYQTKRCANRVSVSNCREKKEKVMNKLRQEKMTRETECGEINEAMLEVLDILRAIEPSGKDESRDIEQENLIEQAQKLLLSEK